MISFTSSCILDGFRLDRFSSTDRSRTTSGLRNLLLNRHNLIDLFRYVHKQSFLPSKCGEPILQIRISQPFELQVPVKDNFLSYCPGWNFF